MLTLENHIPLTLNREREGDKTIPDSYKGFYKAVFENSQRAIISIDPEGAVLCHNKPFDLLVGDRAKSLSNEPISNIIRLKNRQHILKAIPKIAANGGRADAFLIKGKTNTLPIKIHVMAALTDEGAVTGYTLFVEDIASREGQRVFLNHIMNLQAKGGMDFQSFVHEVCTQFCKVFGFKMTAMVSAAAQGLRLVLSVPKSDDMGQFEEWLSYFPKVSSETGEIVPLTPEMPLSTYARGLFLTLPIFIEDCLWGYMVFKSANEQQMATMMRQETFLKSVVMWLSSRLGEHLSHAALLNTNEALKTERQMFQDLYRRTPVMMHSINEHGVIIEVSDAWLQTLGYTREEVIGQKSVHFMTPTSRHYAETRVLPGFFETGSVHQVPYSFVRRDGSIVDVELSAIMRQLPNGSKQSFTVMHDITARNKANRELEERTTSLRKANDSLRKFTYIASHDFQEPLRKLQQYAYLLEHEFEEELQEEAREYLGVITGASKRMSALINDLLLYSRTSNNLPNLSEVDLSQVIRNALEHEEATNEHSIDYHLECDILPSIYADALQIQRLMRCLISNCFKFRHPYRKLIIAARIEHAHDTGGFLLRIRDNGIGFEGRFEEKVFEPLQKLHSAQIYKGTGMGLALVKAICDNHHWGVSIHSEINEGAVVTLNIPASALASTTEESLS